MLLMDKAQFRFPILDFGSDASGALTATDVSLTLSRKLAKSLEVE